MLFRIDWDVSTINLNRLGALDELIRAGRSCNLLTALARFWPLPRSTKTGDRWNFTLRFDRWGFHTCLSETFLLIQIAVTAPCKSSEFFSGLAKKKIRENRKSECHKI